MERPPLVAVERCRSTGCLVAMTRAGTRQAGRLGPAPRLPRMTRRLAELVAPARSRPVPHRAVRPAGQARGAADAVRLQPRARPRARGRARAAAGADPPAMVARGGRRRAAAARGRRAAARRARRRRARRADLLALIDAREIEADPFIETLAAWRDYLLGTPGGWPSRRRACSGRPNPEAFRPLGAAYGAAGVLRSVALLARAQRCLLPADVLAQHGLSPEAVIAHPDIRDVLRQLAGEARAWLQAPPRVHRHAIAAALPAVLARRDLRRVRRPRSNAASAIGWR